MNRVHFASATIIAALAIGALPAQAQPYGGSWGDSALRRPYGGSYRAQGPEPSKKVDVVTFRAAGATLGQGGIVVAGVAPPDADPTFTRGPASELDDAPVPPADKLPVYEAAVVDRLAHSGYNTAVSDAEAGQIAEISVSHAVVVPEEAPHKPVSGEASTVISNRGSGFGLALAVDLSKPKKAIVSTRLDVRIRDRATQRVLWEGHAEGTAREGEAGLDNGAVAARLANALFAKFPEGTEVATVQP